MVAGTVDAVAAQELGGLLCSSLEGHIHYDRGQAVKRLRQQQLCQQAVHLPCGCTCTTHSSPWLSRRTKLLGQPRDVCLHPGAPGHVFTQRPCKCTMGSGGIELWVEAALQSHGSLGMPAPNVDSFAGHARLLTSSVKHAGGTAGMAAFTHHLLLLHRGAVPRQPGHSARHPPNDNLH